MLFPEGQALARSFWDSLPKGCGKREGFWPFRHPRNRKDVEERAVGSSVYRRLSGGRLRAACGTLRDSDGQPGRLAHAKSHPLFHTSKPARYARDLWGHAVLGGTMPSSGVPARRTHVRREKRRAGGIRPALSALASRIRGVEDALPISEPLIRETAARRGKWALWLLDRGYAGELLEECGKTLRCKQLRLLDALGRRAAVRSAVPPADSANRYRKGAKLRRPPAYRRAPRARGAL